MRIMPYKDEIKRKEHHKKYMKEVWYPKNKNKHIGYVSNLKKKITIFISDYKRSHKCVDCGFKGENFPDVLEFDHLKDKKFNISSGHNYTSSLSSIIKEIEKCDLVCANCHRIRTFKRRKDLSA